MPLTIAYDLLPKRRTTRTSIVMDHFGIDFEAGRHVVAENLELPITPGDVVLFTGPSGAGKSSLLRAVAAHFEASPALASPRRQSGDDRRAEAHPIPRLTSGARPLTSGARLLTSGARLEVIDIDALALPDAALIDAIPLPLADALRLLSACGLGEARVLLRTPAELSDGQRYRFRLALAVAQTFSPLPREPRADAHQRDRGRGVGGEGAGDAPAFTDTPSVATPSPRPSPPQPADTSRCVERGGEGENVSNSHSTSQACDALSRSERRHCILADEFTATLHRTLAKVVAFNVRRLADRTGIGFLLATTHEDIAGDLDPDVHVRCRLDGQITVERAQASPRQASPRQASPREASPRRESGDFDRVETPAIPRLTSGARQLSGARLRRISFFDELDITEGTKKDWQHFACWHYRSHNLGFVRQVKLLWHGAEPIGICVFVSPPTSLKARNRYFGRSGRWNRESLQALNRQLLMLSRVVLHPTYRGAGLAAWFVRQCCEQSGYPWIETLAQMGHIHPLFERAGFVRVGSSSPPRGRSQAAHSALYGNPVTAETWRKSQHAAPVYYIFDNRQCEAKHPGSFEDPGCLNGNHAQASPRRQSGDDARVEPTLSPD
jgi:ABC-type uncharacterized transport system YnjBCD ATPase subunit/GNAT superfamily N-acetyltransferase